MKKNFLVIVSLLIADNRVEKELNKNPLKNIYSYLHIFKKNDISVEKLMVQISSLLSQEQFDFKVYGRQKKLCSIYRKMLRKKINIEEIDDIIGVTIVVNSTYLCYKILNLIHNNYLYLPDKVDDYIKNPLTKINDPNSTYRAIHTTIILKNNIKAEIQIKTIEMTESQNDHLAYKNKQNEHIFDKICPI